MIAVVVAFLMAVSPGHASGMGMLAPPKHGKVFVIARPSAADAASKDVLSTVTRLAGLGVDYVAIEVRESKNGMPQATFAGAAAGAAPAELGAVLDAVKGKCGLILSPKDTLPSAIVALVRAKGAASTTLFRGTPAALAPFSVECPDCLRVPETQGNKDVLPVLIDRDTRSTDRADGRRGRLLGKAPKLAPLRRPAAVLVDAAEFNEDFAKKCEVVDVLPFISTAGVDTWQRALQNGALGVETDQPEQLIKLLEANTPTKP